MRFRLEATVTSIISQRPGAQELWVQVLDECELRNAEPGNTEPGNTEPSKIESENEPRRATNLCALTGEAAVGDRVLLNVIANELALGTGGSDFVVAVFGAHSDGEAPGHIIKLRYTPLQIPVLAVEAPESPHHETLRDFTNLNDIPVVCAELHSQLPGICAAAFWTLTHADESRKPRIVYIMTDGASLPIALSRLVAVLKEKGLISATITAGQAFGGDYEAVNLYSALAAAKDVAHADVIVIAQGPGTVGTGTPLGFSGIDQGLAINAAAGLGGSPIAVARISFADHRERHQGISHHTVTVLTRVAMARALIPIPILEAEQQQILASTLEQTGISEMHQPVTIDAERGLTAMASHGIGVTTMGRDLNQERPFFLSAAAAGLLAAQIVETHRAQKMLT